MLKYANVCALSLSCFFLLSFSPNQRFFSTIIFNFVYIFHISLVFFFYSNLFFNEFVHLQHHLIVILLNLNYDSLFIFYYRLLQNKFMIKAISDVAVVCLCISLRGFSNNCFFFRYL